MLITKTLAFGNLEPHTVTTWFRECKKRAVGELLYRVPPNVPYIHNTRVYLELQLLEL